MTAVDTQRERKQDRTDPVLRTAPGGSVFVKLVE